MKLKILVVPILIAAIIVFIIWKVIPAAKDITAKKQEIESSRARLADIRQKNLNVSLLDGDFMKNAGKWSVLMKFIPYEESDEDIINNLDHLAVESEVLLKSLDASRDSSVKTQLIAGKDFKKGAKLENFDVTVVVGGSYEKIKLFLEKVSQLERYNNCGSLKISKDEEEGAREGSLLAEAALNFAYMPKDDAVDVSTNEGVFSGATFDLSVIGSIQEKMKTGLIGLQVGETGSVNPFAPLK